MWMKNMNADLPCVAVDIHNEYLQSHLFMCLSIYWSRDQKSIDLFFFYFSAHVYPLKKKIQAVHHK